MKTGDKRSGRIVVVSHCILNVHSLEDHLAIYPGLEEEVVNLLTSKGVGIFQLPCPEMDLFGIFRKPLPKEAYEHPRVRDHYHKLAEKVVKQLEWFKRKGYKVAAVLGAEGSPTCGIDLVGKWKDKSRKRRFSEDVVFIHGMGVFMEELKRAMEERGILTNWIGIPGKSIRSRRPEAFEKALEKMEKILG
jgi:predicted secreted protein